MIEQTLFKNIKELLNKGNYPKYVEKQILYGLYTTCISDFDQITNISKELRIILKTELGSPVKLTKILENADSESSKILFSTENGLNIESVRMEYPTHTALCISCQSGCAMGCKFCATGAIGFNKNLSADEIVDQYMYFKRKKIDVGTIFFSGMGEPLSNPETFEALKIFTDPNMVAISPRKISLSTVGIIPGIYKLTEEFPNVNLAFSLHSPFPEQRLEIMPVTKAFPIDQVFVALDDHVIKTNKKVFIAYILLGDVNDSLEHSKALVKLIKSRGKKSYLYHVNLIRFNPGPTIMKFNRPNEAHVSVFMDYLVSQGIQTTIRQSKGLEIDAACGQLYANYQKKM